MASPSMTPPPPPPGGDSSAPQAPTSPAAASPSPAQPSTGNPLTTMMIDIVRNLRAIAKATPQAAPIVRDINNKMRELERVIMETATPGEPQAPPT